MQAIGKCMAFCEALLPSRPAAALAAMIASNPGLLPTQPTPTALVSVPCSAATQRPCRRGSTSPRTSERSSRPSAIIRSPCGLSSSRTVFDARRPPSVLDRPCQALHPRGPKPHARPMSPHQVSEALRGGARHPLERKEYLLYNLAQPAKFTDRTATRAIGQSSKNRSARCDLGAGFSQLEQGDFLAAHNDPLAPDTVRFPGTPARNSR